MQEWIDIAPDAEVDDSEYLRLLGYPPGRVLEGRARELAQQARDWYRRNGRPWIYFRRLSQLELADDSLLLEGVRFHSPHLVRHYREVAVDSAFAIAVSAGPECVDRAQELWKASKPDEYFFMEMLGGAVVERLIAQASARLCDWAAARGQLALPHYSPGYPEWEVSEQGALLRLLQAGARQALPGPVECLPSGMLRPKKSLLAVVGLTADVEKASSLADLIPCQRCPLASCAYRRKPYRFALEATAAMSEEDSSSRPPPYAEQPQVGLDLEMPYQTNRRALRKWSEERLDLEERSDGSVEARFRYEGSTCSNMGHPLEFVYAIRLGSSSSGFRIEQARCAPASQDSGHVKMCEYLKRGASFMGELQGEAPLLGQPLDAVGQWTPDSSYAGCYCDQAARDHKWRMAYEVVHYALRERLQARRRETDTPAQSSCG